MIAPILLGDGLRLFADSGTEQKWHLKNVVAYKNGFVELSYRRQSQPRLSGSFFFFTSVPARTQRHAVTDVHSRHDS